jgi:hypothetical protein
MRLPAFSISGLLLFWSFHIQLPVWAQEASIRMTQAHVMGAGQFLWLNDPLGPRNGAMTGRRVYGVGYQVGFGIEHKLDPSVGIRAELQWSERCTRMTVNGTQLSHGASNIEEYSEVGIRSFRLRALQLPLLCAWQLKPDLTVLAGPVFSHVLAVQERFEGSRFSADGEVFEGDERMDRTAYFRPMELALMLGLEVEGHAGLRFGVRYLQGLTDLERWDGSSPSMASAIQVAVTLPVLRGRMKSA